MDNNTLVSCGRQCYWSNSGSRLSAQTPRYLRHKEEAVRIARKFNSGTAYLRRSRWSVFLILTDNVEIPTMNRTIVNAHVVNGNTDSGEMHNKTVGAQ